MGSPLEIPKEANGPRGVTRGGPRAWDGGLSTRVRSNLFLFEQPFFPRLDHALHEPDQLFVEFDGGVAHTLVGSMFGHSFCAMVLGALSGAGALFGWIMPLGPISFPTFAQARTNSG